MRGIEAALKVLSAVEKGGFASQKLRDLPLDAPDRTLAASLVYACLRRAELWRFLAFEYLRPKPEGYSPSVRLALQLGAAGALELKNFAVPALVNGLVDWTKRSDRGGAKVVNAVMRRLLDQGPARLEQLGNDRSLEARSLLFGVPLWAARLFTRDYGSETGDALLKTQQSPVALALRVSRSDLRERVLASLGASGWNASPSDLLSESIRLETTALPPCLPGYDAGLVTPQSETSMSVAHEAAASCPEGRILDMCAGRAVKSGAVLQANVRLTLEGWDLSKPRVLAGMKELTRLNLTGRAKLRTGDALELVPEEAPDAILVDAPCSGSGTWRRHPEAKWRLSESDLASNSALQRRLLDRACRLVKPGGTVIYSTCSLFAAENEAVVSQVIEETPMTVEPLSPSFKFDSLRSPGAVAFPSTPWNDGFYLVKLRRPLGKER